MKQYKTLNNRLCILIVRLACQYKWRQLAFALYNYESHFSDDLKGRIMSILFRCSDFDIDCHFKSVLSREESSLMNPCFSRYYDCFYLLFVTKL